LELPGTGEQIILRNEGCRNKWFIPVQLTPAEFIYVGFQECADQDQTAIGQGSNPYQAAKDSGKRLGMPQRDCQKV